MADPPSLLHGSRIDSTDSESRDLIPDQHVAALAVLSAVDAQTPPGAGKEHAVPPTNDGYEPHTKAVVARTKLA